MDATLKALADLLLEAVPTIFFFLFLTWYLKRTFFQPVGAILEQRRRETEGVRALAQKAFEAADQRQSEFEHAMQMARQQIYEEHEALRRQWMDEEAQQMAAARAEITAEVDRTKQDLAGETEQAKADLDQSVEGLSQQIVNAVLERRAA